MDEIIYLISYDIDERLSDYSSLKEAIKSYGDYQHPMETVWFIRVDEDISVNEVADRLRSYLHYDDDHIFVVEIPRGIPRQGWLPKSFWKWLKK